MLEKEKTEWIEEELRAAVEVYAQMGQQEAAGVKF